MQEEIGFGSSECGLLRRISAEPPAAVEAESKHFDYITLTLLGIGATIGAGIFVMPGMIAALAGPAGIVSFVIVGLYFCAVGNKYEKFSRVLPHGVSAYSYTYFSVGELPAWIVAWGLFVEYFFGVAAVAIGFSSYLSTAAGYTLPAWLSGPSPHHFGINVVAMACVGVITLILLLSSVKTSALINSVLVTLKVSILLTFLVAGSFDLNPYAGALAGALVVVVVALAFMEKLAGPYCVARAVSINIHGGRSVILSYLQEWLTDLVRGLVFLSSRMNAFAYVYKGQLLVSFIAALALAVTADVVTHSGFIIERVLLNPLNWVPFAPMGHAGILAGAALAVFPYVGFDAQFGFARESKSHRDTKIATYLCVGSVAFIYILVMVVMTGLAPAFIADSSGHLTVNPLFHGDESAAPLANLMIAVGKTWTAKFISVCAVLGLFNVILVLCKAAPRVFRNMAEDGLLPACFEKTKNGNPVIGVAVNGVICMLLAGFVPFRDISEMMVLGTLVAFMFVGLGSLRLEPEVAAGANRRLAFALSYFASFVVVGGSITLMLYLNPLVLKLYSITCPIGLVFYFAYGFRHSKLARAQSGRS